MVLNVSSLSRDENHTPGGAVTPSSSCPTVTTNDGVAEESPASSKCAAHLQPHLLLEGDPQSSNGFIFVTQSLPSGSQFTEWVDQQHLPDAQTLVKGRRVREDEVELFLDRASFIRDLVKTFCKSSLKPNDEHSPCSTSKKHSEEKDAKEKETPGASCGGDGSGSPKSPQEFKETVLAGDSTESQSIAALENPRTWERVWKQFVLDLPRQNMYVQDYEGDRTIGVDEAYQVIMQFLQSLPDHVQEKISKFGLQPSAPSPAASTKVRWMYSLLSPFSLVAGGNQKEDENNTSELTPPEKEKENDRSSEKKALQGLQRLERFICLLCQQSVLAVPFEIIATQYMQPSSSPDTQQLFVGEVSKTPGADSGTMKITLNKKPQGTSPRGKEGTKEATANASSSGDMPQLKIEKLFRVFALDEEEGDITLFHVASELLVDLLAPPDEPLVMTWRILDASRKERKKPSDALLSAVGGVPLTKTPPRNCECLGASSGFHKEGYRKEGFPQRGVPQRGVSTKRGAASSSE